MGVLILMFLFSYGITFLLQYFLKISDSSILFMLIHLVLALIIYVMYFFKTIKKNRLTRNEIILLLFSAFLIIEYFIVGICFNLLNNETYFRYLKYLFVSFLPSILLGIMVFYDKKNIIKALNFSPIFFWTITLGLIVIVANNIGSAKVINDFNYNGLTYQAISYYFAYSFSILLFLNFFGNKIELNRWIKTRVVKYINYIFMAIDLFGCISVGGRGGIVLVFLILIFSLFVLYKDNKNIFSSRNIFKFFILSIAFLVVLMLVSKSEYSQMGIERFFDLFFESKDASRDGRFVLWEKAILSFEESPIIGYGFGSVFAKVEYYSHNIFLDVLVETGLIGLIAFLVLLCFIIRSVLLNLTNKLNLFIFYIFLLGIVMLQFSGYHLSEAMLIFPVAFFSNKLSILKKIK